MASAPVISIFLSKGGPSVAHGVLVQGRAGAAGLFSPWPATVTGNVKFGVYVPASTNEREEWLAPDEVGILKGIDKGVGTLGLVSFTSYPARAGGIETIDEKEFLKLKERPNSSYWDALKAARENDFEMLGTLRRSLPSTLISRTRRERKPVKAGAARMFTARAADVKPRDFFCRYLLRWD